MDYRIFNMRTDVNASDCTQGCMDTHKSLHWKLTLGEKSLAATGNQTRVSSVTVWCSNQLSYTSPPWSLLKKRKRCSGAVTQIQVCTIIVFLLLHRHTSLQVYFCSLKPICRNEFHCAMINETNAHKKFLLMSHASMTVLKGCRGYLVS